MVERVKETRLVFDREGRTILWPHDPHRSAGYLPDNQTLWDFLWDNRERLGGVAHTHPWEGPVWASYTDVTTFSAIEKGLGRRLLWPIVTFTDIQVFAWVGPGDYDYAPLSPVPFVVEGVEDLRLRSRMDG